MRNLWVLLLLAVPSCVIAESSFEIPSYHCVWRPGDNPAWASPNLDESGWRVFPDFRHRTARTWVRCHADLARLQAAMDPALQIRFPEAYELFVNGQLLGKSGNLALADGSVDTMRSYPLPAKLIHDGPAFIALRVALRPNLDGDIDLPAIRAGDSKSLDAMRAEWLLGTLWLNFSLILPYCVVGVIGLLLLGLFFYDQTRRDILWLSLACVLEALSRVVILLRCVMVDYSSQVERALFLIAGLSFVFQVLFFFAIAQRRVPRALWLVVALAYCSNVTDIVRCFATPAFAWQVNAVTTRFPVHSISLCASACLNLSPFLVFWPWAHQPTRLRPLILCCVLWGPLTRSGSRFQRSGRSFSPSMSLRCPR